MYKKTKKETTLVVTKYPTHFEAVPGSYSFISESELQLVDNAIGIGPGVRYLSIGGKDVAVVFRSNSLEDIHQIQKNNGWSNTVGADRTYPGITVYVIPTAEVRKLFPGTPGIKYTLRDTPYKEKITDKQWASEA